VTDIQIQTQYATGASRRAIERALVAAGKDDFPVPWADRPEYRHLTTSDRLRTAIETSGFEIEQWNDLTGAAVQAE
jgi:hypothetical protein